MPIRFRCHSCQARIKVPDGTEGKKVKCPRCGGTQRVPQQSSMHDTAEMMRGDIPVASPRHAHEPGEDRPRSTHAAPAPEPVAEDPLAALAALAGGGEAATHAAPPPEAFEPEPESAPPSEAAEPFQPPHVPQPSAASEPDVEDPLAALAALASQPAEAPEPETVSSGDSLFDMPVEETEQPASSRVELSLSEEPDPPADVREASAVAMATSDIEAKLAQDSAADESALIEPYDLAEASEPAPADDLAALAAASGAPEEKTLEHEPVTRDAASHRGTEVPEPQEALDLESEPSEPEPVPEPVAAKADALAAAVTASVAKPVAHVSHELRSPVAGGQPRPVPKVTTKVAPKPPKKIPLSSPTSSPAAVNRPRPQPQPSLPEAAPPRTSIVEEAESYAVPPVMARRSERTTPPPAMMTLLAVTWVLRVLAFFMVGGAVKLYLVTQQHDWDAMGSVAVMLAGFCLAAVTWAAAEIAGAVRAIARKK